MDVHSPSGSEFEEKMLYNRRAVECDRALPVDAALGLKWTKASGDVEAKAGTAEMWLITHKGANTAQGGCKQGSAILGADRFLQMRCSQSYAE